jgi:two-component system, response regulator PdtaR
MTLARLVQNFSGSRAYLIGVSETAGPVLISVLGKLGLSAQTVEPSVTALDGLAVQGEGDVLIVDGDADVPAAGPLSRAAGLPGAPVVALVGVETPGRLKALMGLGATAFIKKPVQPSGVYSALFLGINQYRMRRSLSDIIASHEERRRGRRGLVKSILRLTEQGIDDEAAYELLRREAMRARLSVEAYCELFLRDASQAKPEEALSACAASKLQL